MTTSPSTPLRRHEKHRQRDKLYDHREGNKEKKRPPIQKSGRDTAHQPTGTVSGIEEAKREIAPSFREQAGDNRFEQGILCAKSDAPQNHTDDSQGEVSKKDQGCKERRSKDGQIDDGHTDLI